MREIKFRAWIISAKQWYGEDIKWFPLKFISLNEIHKDLVFTQFTGLFDKNGKEIWEGDIVTVYNYLNGKIWEGHIHNQLVIFKKGRFEMDNCWGGESLATSEVKVIGNIWENPELLDRR